MTDDPAFILVRIADLSKDLQQAEMLFYGLAVVLCIAIVAMIWMSLRGNPRDDTAFVICIGIIIVVGVTLVTLIGEASTFETEMNSLITAYETLYGPLPEGIL